MKENNIEKDEEILNNIKAYMQENIDNGCHKFVYNDLGYDEKCVDVINAIEHILSDYKRALKENEEKTTILLAGAEKVKQLEKENNRLEEQVEYDKTHIYTPQTIELNFISKSKIEDKIEELKKNLHTVEHYETVGAIHVLQELLEENENHIPRIN